MLYGYAGKVLFVNLTDGTFEIKDLEEQAARDFQGGHALGAYYLYKYMKPHTPVFDPESWIGFFCGQLNGDGTFMSPRYMVVSKSPVTNGWNDANSGGAFGPNLRQAGFDAVMVHGISPKPVYLEINDGVPSLHDATKMWGMTTLETEAALREELGLKKVSAAIIGPGGENLSWYAAVMNDSHRAAGRGGSGAVMGSKKLKAIVPHGGKKPEVYDKEALKKANKDIMDWQKNGPLKDLANTFKQYGTGASYGASLLSGDCIVLNGTGAGVTDVAKEDVEALGAPEMDKKYRVKKFACNGCSIGCGAIYQLLDGKYKIEDTGRPEYETQGGFGPMCGNNSDTEALNQCNFLCNEYGLDTISCAGTISWVMECCDHGELGAEQLDGKEYHMGDVDGMVELCEKICKGEGVGEILQKGSRYCAEYWGVGYDRLVTAGGIELAMHDSRFAPMLARTLKFDPTPGRHVKGGLGANSGNEPAPGKFDYDNKIEADVNGTILYEVIHSGGFCEFTDWGYDTFRHYLDVENAVTGFNYTREDLDKIGKRDFFIRQAFNLREGITRKDATISDRMIGVPPLEKGPLAGVTVPVDHLGDNFFGAMGCDLETGMPTLETYREIGGMDIVIKDFYPEAVADAQE